MKIIKAIQALVIIFILYPILGTILKKIGRISKNRSKNLKARFSGALLCSISKNLRKGNYEIADLKVTQLETIMRLK